MGEVAQFHHWGMPITGKSTVLAHRKCERKGNMKTFTVRDNAGQSWKRVSKVAARKAFNNGNPVHVCPSNLMPFGYWGCGITCLPGFEQHEYVAPNSHPFDYWVKNFEWYNCTGRETGLYASFYVQVQ